MPPDPAQPNTFTHGWLEHELYNSASRAEETGDLTRTTKTGEGLTVHWGEVGCSHQVEGEVLLQQTHRRSPQRAVIERGTQAQCQMHMLFHVAFTAMLEELYSSLLKDGELSLRKVEKVAQVYTDRQ